MAAALSLRSPDTALASVWRASELGFEPLRTLDTGHAALNAVLPGGGWPVGALVELLQDTAHAEWRLLAPLLATLGRAPGSPSQVVLVGAPWLPFAPALAGQGIAPQQLLSVQGDTPAALLWATGQALRCADVAAVLAWLPRSKSASLRRLQVAAQQHGKLLFVVRGMQAHNDSSPAPLRLALSLAPGPLQHLRVDVFKRRGPPLAQPVELTARPARLQALLAASRARARRRQPAPVAAVPVQGVVHALACLAANDDA